MPMAEQTLNIPQLLVFVIVSVLAVRWYLSKKPEASGPQSGAPHRSTARYTPAQVDHIANMFPQLDRRQIAWDLHRNGGNVAATAERVLTGQGLDMPPPTFQPQLPRPAPSTRTLAPTAKGSKPDLITRYNLSSKLNGEPETPPEPAEQKKSWSADRSERQANLQRRREEMILAARRKLEAKQKGKAPALPAT